MPFSFESFGKIPEGGRSLYFSLHGGGGAPPAINDRQWENQQRLYQLEEGIYLDDRQFTDNLLGNVLAVATTAGADAASRHRRAGWCR